MVRMVMTLFWKHADRADCIRLRNAEQPCNVTLEENIRYLSDQNRKHTLDCIRPKQEKGPFPVIVDIHGGGWMYGSTEVNRPYCMALAAEGSCAVVAMNYRLLPETDLQGQVQDIFAALHWLEKNGEAYHFDLNDILLTGDSAGGHLAGLAASIQNDENLQRLYGVEPVSFSIGALALTHPVWNIHQMGFAKGTVEKLVNREYARMMFGGKPELSPFYAHASLLETLDPARCPKVFLQSSKADVFCPQSVYLDAWLTEHKVTHEFLCWKKEELEHVFAVTGPNRPESVETRRRMLRFWKGQGSGFCAADAAISSNSGISAISLDSKE